MRKREFEWKALVGFFWVLFVIVDAESLLADEQNLEAAFERAKASDLGLLTQVSYEIVGCTFKETIVNLDYCHITSQGDGNRTIRTTVDLREVEEINVREVRGKFLMSFELDFGGPGPLWLFGDLILNGEEGSRERYFAEYEAALKAAKLNSSKTFTACGSVNKQPNSSSYAVITAQEPEGWRNLVDLARECRAPRGLQFTDDR